MVNLCWLDLIFVCHTLVILICHVHIEKYRKSYLAKTHQIDHTNLFGGCKLGSLKNTAGFVLLINKCV